MIWRRTSSHREGDLAFVLSVTTVQTASELELDSRDQAGTTTRACGPRLVTVNPYRSQCDDLHPTVFRIRRMRESGVWRVGQSRSLYRANDTGMYTVVEKTDHVIFTAPLHAQTAVTRRKALLACLRGALPQAPVPENCSAAAEGFEDRPTKNAKTFPSRLL